MTSKNVDLRENVSNLLTENNGHFLRNALTRVPHEYMDVEATARCTPATASVGRRGRTGAMGRASGRIVGGLIGGVWNWAEMIAFRERLNACFERKWLSSRAPVQSPLMPIDALLAALEAAAVAELACGRMPSG